MLIYICVYTVQYNMSTQLTSVVYTCVTCAIYLCISHILGMYIQCTYACVCTLDPFLSALFFHYPCYQNASNTDVCMFVCRQLHHSLGPTSHTVAAEKM